MLNFCCSFQTFLAQCAYSPFLDKGRIESSCCFLTLRVSPTCPAHWNSALATETPTLFSNPFFFSVTLSPVSALFHASPWNFALYLFAHFQICIMFVFFLFFSSFMFKMNAYDLLILQCSRSCCTCVHITNRWPGASVYAFVLEVRSCKRKLGQKNNSMSISSFPLMVLTQAFILFFQFLGHCVLYGLFLEGIHLCWNQLEDSSLSLQTDIFIGPV